MRRRRLLKLLGLGLVSLCGLKILDGSDADSLLSTGTLSEKQFLDHEGRSRSYRLYVPNPLPTTCAAVLLLHGHGGSADQLMGVVAGRNAPYRLWMPIADREGLILIIPDGLVSPDGKQGWNDARNIPTNPDSNDVDFLMTLIETVSESYPIDFQRLYATGTSNGGQMALRLAAEASDKLAAVAAVVASNPDPIFARRPQQSISVMLMNGTNDRFIPYDGGSVIDDRGQVQSTDDSIQYWVTHNGCEQTPREIQYPNQSNVDGCTASRMTYTHATANVEVSLVRVLNGGHTEPSIQQPYSRLYLAIVGRQNRDIEMADEVWTFFQGKSVSSEPLS
ncbi:MAG: prolyl oligopeptidase family serine peptidase [Cyanobacteria bacterium P01_F01_bin.53]